jgi:hypothetical protein
MDSYRRRSRRQKSVRKTNSKTIRIAPRAEKAGRDDSAPTFCAKDDTVTSVTVSPRLNGRSVAPTKPLLAGAHQAGRSRPADLTSR